MDPILSLIVAGLVSAVGAAAYWVGRKSRSAGDSRLDPPGKRLEEYGFYPFVTNEDGHVEFDPELFIEASEYLLENENPRAGRELIVIGEQNLVRDTLSSESLAKYKRLYERYGGDDVVSDNDAYLENFRRLVNQIGRSFPNTGIEILLHNLVNPSRSLVAIENGEVTGRQVGSGATNLVLDLKTRRQRGEDKVNYELNIGSRQFKCTTVPIFRSDYGLVGAICINVDVNFIREVTSDVDRVQAFVDNLVRTDFELDENILSKDEYRVAMRGKRHFMDDAIRATGARRVERKLKAIYFSDIVDYTSLMGKDEARTLEIVEVNESIHLKAFSDHRGHLLKRLGDGLLASFDTASGAVECAIDVMNTISQDDRFNIRVGIHLGEIVEEYGDVHGDGVNIASRIQSVVDPGQVGISGVVYDNIKNKGGVTATSLGERALKNVETPMRLYSLDL